MEMKQVYIEQMYRMRMSVYERLDALKSIIYNYVSENGGTVEIPDEWEDADREIEHTCMAVMNATESVVDAYMNATESVVDAYIEGIRTDGTGLVIWGTRSDGDGETGECPFDAILNAVNVADFIQKLEQIRNRKEE